MFTGIIEAVGFIEKIQNRSGDQRFNINVGQLDLSDVAIGDSIACNGVCLTVIELGNNGYVADVSAETLNLTTMSQVAINSKMNLEKALTPTTRLGGHLVSGHVDGVAEIIAITKAARSIQYAIKAPQALAHYIAKKGSITLDGISLTVNEIKDNIFQINLVPHTLQETIANDYQVGDKINIEVDLLARYLERLLLGQLQTVGENKSSAVDYQLLMNSGFIKA